jgi:hypothetical protein
MGEKWKKIDGVVRQGTASLTGSDADNTAHKNVHGDILASSIVKGDVTFNFQCADIGAANRMYFMGGTVTTTAAGTQWKAPDETQAIYRSVQIVGKNNVIDYAVNVRFDAFIAKNDNDLAYLQVNGTVEKPTKADTESSGSYDNFPVDATDVLTYSMAEQTGAATIDNTLHTIAIEVANGTDVTALVPTFTVSLGADTTPYSGDADDFTSPVTFVVEAADGTQVTYTVTVTVAV